MYSFIRVPVFFFAILVVFDTNASLIGDSAGANLSSICPEVGDGACYVNILTQLDTPKIIGAGVEFQGLLSQPGQELQIGLGINIDVYEQGFTVEFFAPSSFQGHSGPNFLRLDLLDLDWMEQPGYISGMSRLDNIFSKPGFFGVASYGFEDNSAYVIFNGVDAGQRYDFSLEAKTVPEPPVIGLMLSGIIGLGIARWKIKSSGHK